MILDCTDVYPKTQGDFTVFDILITAEPEYFAPAFRHIADGIEYDQFEFVQTYLI